MSRPVYQRVALTTMIGANMAWNGLFVLMSLSEMLGVTSVHGSLPWWLKWIWLVALASGNLLIHVAMLRRVWWQQGRVVRPNSAEGL